MHMRILITVKTYPIPSATYDELVCTAGVLESGDFVRLYPINFRDLPFAQQYKKYQWIEVEAQEHKGRDLRKESYRPDCGTLRVVGKPIPTRGGDWSDRARYVLKKKAASLEELQARQREDRTSLGIFKPKKVHDLVVSRDSPEWKPAFKAALTQARLWDDRRASKEPPRKVPFKFHYEFECDDPRCKAHHKMMVEDWELGALFWKLRDQGDSDDTAAAKVRDKFLGEICAPDTDTHFFVGTHFAHPKSWMVIGLFWPKLAPPQPSGLFNGMS
jgi:hypothetical protein